MYDDLDFTPVELELTGVTSEEYRSGELSEAAFGEDNRWIHAVCSNKGRFYMREVSLP